MSQEHQEQAKNLSPDGETSPETPVSPAGEPAEPSVAQEAAPKSDKPGNKPVVVYIMILFIAAFLLMALSFFMHQRSNTEVMGELKHSVSAMQEIQAAQEKIIELQEEISDLQEQLEEDTAAAGELQEERDALERRSDALLTLYQLQQLYSAKQYEACEDLITEFETGLADSLPQESLDGGIVSPAERYQELKAAVEAKLG